MADKPGKPGTLYVVSQLQDGKWQDVLSTTNEARARALLKTLGEKGKLEVFAPRPPKRR